jgi:putative transposase
LRQHIEAQIVFILCQGDEGTAVGEIYREAGISEATNYDQRKKCACLLPSEMKRLRQLEEENSKLNKVVADLAGPACRALPVSRSTIVPAAHGRGSLNIRIRGLAASRVRYGYRRIHVHLLREGWRLNPKRDHRFYRELGLQLRNEAPK